MQFLKLASQLGHIVMSSQISDNDISAFLNSTSKAQLDARHADADPTTLVYYDTMINSYQTIGWQSIKLTDYSYPPSLLQLSIASVNNGINSFKATQTVSPALFKLDPLLILSGILNSLPQEVINKIDAFLDEWWGLTYFSEQKRYFGMSSIMKINDQLNVFSAYYCFSINFTSWKDVIQLSGIHNFTCTVKAYDLTLDSNIYDNLADQIYAELQKEGIAEIQFTTIDI